MEFCRFIGILLLFWQILGVLGAPQNLDVQRNSDATNGESDRVEPVLYVREDFNDTERFLVIDDMIITRQHTKAGLLHSSWPKGIVPYSFALTILPQQRTMILSAISDITSKTCVKFRPARSDDKYWLLYQNDPTSRGCWSHVGCQHVKNQPIQMSTSCGKGNAVHETIHALGFYHEQSRNDRDEYVKIHYENILSGHEQNFYRDNEADPADGPETSYFHQPYNYESIMHYGAYFFSKNDEMTIETLDHKGAIGSPDKMGQREYLTPGDIGMIKNKYHCPEQPSGPNPPPSGTQPDGGNGNPMCQFWLC